MQRSLLRRARDRLGEPVGEGPAALAAAVCFRRRETGLQLRLVRSASGERWTFPMLRQKPGQPLSETATAAASQQAGVSGVVEDNPFTEFRYGRRKEDVAVAFLLAVQSVAPTGEPGRDPTWCDLPTAGLRMAEARAEAEAQEMRRVLLLVEQELR